jgi:hypothetical protein
MVFVTKRPHLRCTCGSSLAASREGPVRGQSDGPLSYFDADVVLNADWLHHLRYCDRRERSKLEQMLKFRSTTVRLRVPLRAEPRFLSCESRSFFFAKQYLQR